MLEMRPPSLCFWPAPRRGLPSAPLPDRPAATSCGARVKSSSHSCLPVTNRAYGANPDLISEPQSGLAACGEAIEGVEPYGTASLAQPNTDGREGLACPHQPWATFVPLRLGPAKASPRATGQRNLLPTRRQARSQGRSAISQPCFLPPLAPVWRPCYARSS